MNFKNIVYMMCVWPCAWRGAGLAVRSLCGVRSSSQVYVLSGIKLRLPGQASAFTHWLTGSHSLFFKTVHLCWGAHDMCACGGEELVSLPLCGSQGSSFCCHACGQATLPTESSLLWPPNYHSKTENMSVLFVCLFVCRV